jgi:hypothetical protein
MPPHLSYLLWPLNVSCFTPLKRAYGYKIDYLIRCHVNYITKTAFLLAFKAAFNQSFTLANIRLAF